MNRNVIFCALSLVIVLSANGCKDDKSSGPDFSGMAKSISSPTGSVSDVETALGVSEAFGERLNSSDMMPTGQSVTMDCSVSGKIRVNGDESAATFSYNDCCEMEDCCFDGSGSMSMGVADFMMCMSFNLNVDCMGSTGPMDMEYCQGEDGDMWFVIEYEGSTFACSGNFDSEYGGKWTIRDADGEWNCEATCTNGDCTGSCSDGSDTYEW